MTWNDSITYNSQDVLRMQQDAIKRVKDMQSRAQQNIDATNHYSSQTNSNKLATHPPAPVLFENNNNTSFANETNSKPSNAQQNLFQNILGGGLKETIGNLTDIPQKAITSISSVLEGFGIDNDRLIIMGLIYLLSSEKGDKTLLLALAYLLF